MNIASYIIRRLLFAIVVILSVLTITFILSHSLDGNPVVAWLGRSASLYPGLAKIYTAQYHLNDSLPVQCYYYLVNLAHGNLGLSPSRGFIPVSQAISQTLPLTLQIIFFGFVISVLMARAQRTNTHSIIDEYSKPWPNVRIAPAHSLPSLRRPDPKPTSAQH